MVIIKVDSTGGYMQLIKALIELIKSLFTRKKKVNRDVIVDLYKIPEGIDLNNKADREVLANQLFDHIYSRYIK